MTPTDSHRHLYKILYLFLLFQDMHHIIWNGWHCCHMHVKPVSTAG